MGAANYDQKKTSNTRSRRRRIILLLNIIAIGLLILTGSQPCLAQAHPAAQEMQMPGMAHDHGMTSEGSVGKPWCEDTAWSAYNHRVAGWFLLFWGLAALVAGLLWPRRTWWRYVPAMVLFGLTEFLFFRNDPEAWPIGPVSLRASLHDPESFQHRVFLLLILAIALIELLRAAERLPILLARYGLPVLAVLGGIYLFFHKHGGHMAEMMTDPAMASSPGMQQMMTSMNLVRHEHLLISLIGFGLAATKLLGDMGTIKGRWGATLWPIFAIFLGAYLTGYVE
jgi:hypothetical protein